MKLKIREWLSVQIAKNPGKIVLITILLFNVVFFFVAAVVISELSLSGTEHMDFLQAAFCTVTMILDAGCIQFVVADIGQAGVSVVIVCLVIIFIGMISFTGAVIGYITNYISNFIEDSNAGSKRLHISGHIVILNWNTRASEIINDLLYCKKRQKVVVLVNNKDDIEKEIEERLSDTIARENSELRNRCEALPLIKKIRAIRKNTLHNMITVVVRDGDVFSSKQLHDISIERAKTIIILGNDINKSICKFGNKEQFEKNERGNSHTVKTLMQVADITSATTSADNQKIIVEITDDWTFELVDKIIKCKQVREKCNIIPVRVNQILGQILAQFSLMPELNMVYRELFSNKGASFFTEPYTVDENKEFIWEYLSDHKHAIPLTHMESDGLEYHYFSSASEKDVHTTSAVSKSDYSVDLNSDYWIEDKNVIILGHNSKCKDIMQGFSAFISEWNYKDGQGEILRVIVIDEQENLEKMDYYKEYPFVVETVAASIYDKDYKDLICSKIERFISSYSQKYTSVLILSDDTALNENIDADALTNLIYVQDIINSKKKSDIGFNVNSIDVIVEIIDPKHHDIVNSYSVNNVVISNRYISKMIMQIGEKEALFDFYTDILTYDTDVSEGYQSKEIYTKKINRFFNSTPKKCTADELIRAVYKASADKSLPVEKYNPTVVLGYVKQGENVVLFNGNQSSIKVELGENDKLIVFSNH